MGTRYHPCVIWGPFLLALALGLVVSAGLYFAYLWPQVEPDEDAASATEDKAAGPVESEPETEAAAPATESSPA